MNKPRKRCIFIIFTRFYTKKNEKNNRKTNQKKKKKLVGCFAFFLNRFFPTLSRTCLHLSYYHVASHISQTHFHCFLVFGQSTYFSNSSQFQTVYRDKKIYSSNSNANRLQNKKSEKQYRSKLSIHV